MRRRFQSVVGDFIENDEAFVLLLGDIGVFGFRDVMASHPTRVLNMGILEQGMISFAAGLALSGKIPIVHTITPFLIERAYEQLKVDFGYQHLTGKFISVGGSFEYSALGATHHGPADVVALLGIPGFQIFLPASAAEAESLIRRHIRSDGLGYFRIVESEFTNEAIDVLASSPQVLSDGSNCVVVAFGPSVTEALQVAKELGLKLVYMNEITNDSIGKLNRLLSQDPCSTVALIQPFYEGSVVHLFLEGLRGKTIIDVGVPRQFIHEYGSPEDLKVALGLDAASIVEKIKGAVFL